VENSGTGNALSEQVRIGGGRSKYFMSKNPDLGGEELKNKKLRKSEQKLEKEGQEPAVTTVLGRRLGRGQRGEGTPLGTSKRRARERCLPDTCLREGQKAN